MRYLLIVLALIAVAGCTVTPDVAPVGYDWDYGAPGVYVPPPDLDIGIGGFGGGGYGYGGRGFRRWGHEGRGGFHGVAHGGGRHR